MWGYGILGFGLFFIFIVEFYNDVLKYRFLDLIVILFLCNSVVLLFFSNVIDFFFFENDLENK